MSNLDKYLAQVENIEILLREDCHHYAYNNVIVLKEQIKEDIKQTKEALYGKDTFLDFGNSDEETV